MVFCTRLSCRVAQSKQDLFEAFTLLVEELPRRRELECTVEHSIQIVIVYIFRPHGSDNVTLGQCPLASCALSCLGGTFF